LNHTKIEGEEKMQLLKEEYEKFKAEIDQRQVEFSQQ